MSRSSTAELETAAAALTALASLVRSGQGLRRALIEWPTVAPAACLEAIRPLVKATEVDGCISRAAELASSRDGVAALVALALRPAVTADRRGAGFTAAVLEEHATALRRRAATFAEAAAGTSGARLSGRLVAGLPLAFLFFVPTATRPQMDFVGLTILISGICFVWAGMRWMSRLTPHPPEEDPAAAAARELAALLTGGVAISIALRTVAQRQSWDRLCRAEKLTRLGLGWSEALRVDDHTSIGRIASILEAGRRLGHGTADELRRLADELSAGSQREFESRLRRAPVLMVIPLALCILPGFALLTVGPFLRELLA